MEDRQLIQRFKEYNDKRAFEAIISKYENQIYRFGFRMCGHRQDAEDVVQDTFETAYRYLKDFRAETTLLSWLLRIASSVCIKKRRLRKNQPKTLAAYDESAEPGSGEGVTEASDGPSPQDQLLAAEMRKRLSMLLETLPEHYRVVLVLRDVEGLSTKEVADSLEISETAAKVRLHRARAILFKKFEEGVHGRQEEPQRATSL